MPRRAPTRPHHHPLDATPLNERTPRPGKSPRSPSIDYRDPNWPAEALKRNQAAKARRAGAKRVPPRYKASRKAQLAAWTAQAGRCAITACKTPIAPYGPGRSQDRTTGKLICRGCALALNAAGRDPRRLAALMEYLGVTFATPGFLR